MYEVNITVEDAAALRDIDNIDNYVLDETTITMYRAVDVVRSSIVQHSPVGVTGHFRQGWTTSVRRTFNAVRGVVSNPVAHAYYAEYGRGPGKRPPIDAIELWVQRVLGVDKRASRGAAFQIARNIGQRGTRNLNGERGSRAAQKGLAAVKGIIEADFRGVPGRVKARIDAT